jgi:hypothetical protein
MCRHTSIPDASPAEVEKETFVGVQEVRIEPDGRKHLLEVAGGLPVSLARRPSSSPAAASTYAPVQVEAVGVPGRMRPKAGGPPSRPWVCGSSASCDAGTMTVSASYQRIGAVREVGRRRCGSSPGTAAQLTASCSG